MGGFGFAVIGCGAIATLAAKEIVKSGCGRLVSVWSRTVSRAEKFAARFGAVVAPSAASAMTAPGVDFVYVATPNSSHVEYCMLAVSLGVPVLCEKPLALCARDADRIFSFARERRVYVAEAMWTWFNPVSIAVRDAVHGGTIGATVSAKLKFMYPISHMSKNPRLTSPALGGGALLDIGIYPVRYAYELFGMPVSVECVGDVRGGVDYGEEIVFGYDGFDARLSVSMTKLRGESAVVYGSDGKITVPRFHAASRADIVGVKHASVKDRSPKYALEFSSVFREISEGMTESAFNPPRSTVDTLRLLDECRRLMGVKYPCDDEESAE